ncbi:MAG: cation diffusion facilitator family transporter [Solirubrobacterales bacterium]
MKSRGKSGAAAISIASNSILIAMKLAAAAITGSVAILSEALHSGVDLVASVVAFVSVRRADEPADSDHHYGHEKLESFAAAIEGMLVLVGAGVIIYEATRHLSTHAEVETLGLGIAVMAVSAIVNTGVSTYLRRASRRYESPALAGDAAHLGTDALTSVGVLVGLVVVQVTGLEQLDAVMALLVAAMIVFAGVRILYRSGRVLVDESLPPEELDRIEAAIAASRPAEMAGYHRLRARSAGRHRYVDLHVQFHDGTTLERAHSLAHELRDAIEAELPNAEVLIHVEPEGSVRDPGGEPYRAG